MVAAGGDVLAEHVAIGHLADDGVDPLVGEDRLDRGCCFLKPLSMNSLNFGAIVAFPEADRAPLGLHRDDGQVGLGRRVEGAVRTASVRHGPVVVLDHDLVDPAALRRRP